MIAKSIPNLFTIGNLFLGVLSIIFVFNERLDLASIMVIVAMLTDGIDGRVARALNVQSEFGKELDSLSDIISFGVAPAFIVYVVAFQDLNASAWFITAIFPICGALRLARFNVAVGKKPGHFIGLPIPAAGGILSTLALFYQDLGTVALIVSTLLLSALMVSNVKYPSFKRFGIPKTVVWMTPIIVVVAVILAVIFPSQISKIIFIPLVLYALIGLKKNVERLFRRIHRKRREKRERLFHEELFVEEQPVQSDT